jgi:ABC-type sulfate transport system permease component
LLFGLIGVVLALLIVGSITVVQSVDHGLSVLF